MTSDLLIEVEEVEDKVIRRLNGRLDAASFSILEKRLNALIEQKRTLILMDFEEVHYLSSAGMRLLLSFTKKLKSNEGSLVIFSVGNEIMEIIKMAGFERILQICKTEKDALSLF